MSRSVLILLPLAFGLLVSGCREAAPPAGPAADPAVTVVTMEAEEVTLTRELPGRTTLYLVAEVRPQVTGIVQERLFTEGGVVEQGEPLYQLDDATYQADYNRASASQARAEATLELARLNAERTAGLLEANAVSRQERDTAEAALLEAEADLDVAKAAVASAEVLLGYSRITSPISGRIGRSSVTQGALVTANQVESLATVQQLDPIYVDVTQSSRELLQLRRDMAAGVLQPTDELPVTLLLEDGTPYDHPGKVAFSEVVVDPTTGSFSLRVVVPNPDHLLLPGMYVRSVIGHGIRENAILVPQQGIARGAAGEAWAMVVGEDGTVEQRPVRLNRTLRDKWLVDEGLSAGERVVVAGLQKIKPGGRVRITEGVSEAPETTASAQ